MLGAWRCDGVLGDVVCQQPVGGGGVDLDGVTGSMGLVRVGVRAGQMIRLSGQGMPGEAGGPAGDLFLTVHFAPHPVYQVQGRDLSMKLPVAPWEAACGGQVRVPTLQGEVEVSISAGSQPGSKLRLRGKGLPGEPAGDLYLVLDVVWPPATTEAAKEAYQALAKAAPFNPRRHLGVQG